MWEVFVIGDFTESYRDCVEWVPSTCGCKIPGRSQRGSLTVLLTLGIELPTEGNKNILWQREGGKRAKITHQHSQRAASSQITELGIRAV